MSQIYDIVEWWTPVFVYINTTPQRSIDSAGLKCPVGLIVLIIQEFFVEAN